MRHFQKRIPEDIPIDKLLGVIKEVSDGIGSLYEGQVFGDWTIRSNDARDIENVPHFRAKLVLRSDSKKDRTDPVMNFAIDDFFREKPGIENFVLCAGDADYCEVLRRGSRMHKNMYVCAVSPQTAPELLSLAKAFYPIEQRLGLKFINAEEFREALAKLDPAEISKWTPLIKQLDRVENKLPYVVRSHFIKQYISTGLGYGSDFEEKEVFLNLAEQLGLIEYDRVPDPRSGLPVRVVKLNHGHEIVKSVLAQEPH